MCVATKALIEQGKVEGLAEGRAEGRAEGADRVTKLYLHLMDSGQDTEMKKAMKDPEYREQLLKTLNM